MIKDKEKEIVEEFAFFDTWMDKYQYLIDLGKELNLLLPEERIESNRIKGCQSNVWIIIEGKPEAVTIRAASDSAIVSGLISLIIKIYSESPAKEISENQPEFIESIGLSSHLSISRANGLAAMLAKIKEVATKIHQKPN